MLVKYSDIEMTTIIHGFSELIRAGQADSIEFSLFIEESWHNLYKFELRMSNINIVDEFKNPKKVWEYKIGYREPGEDNFTPLTSTFDIRIAIDIMKKKLDVRELEDEN